MAGLFFGNLRSWAKLNFIPVESFRFGCIEHSVRHCNKSAKVRFLLPSDKCRSQRYGYPI